MSEIAHDLIEKLLWMSEVDSLDFKREQYQLEKQSKEVKGELIKDILAMANAWKDSDAHILIGCEKKGGRRATVVGISEHIDDADIQQLIKDKVNVPVRFNYIACHFEEKEIGVLRIPKDHPRPVYLKDDYGGIKKNNVYVRRGSSTVVADPGEVAAMGASSNLVSSIPTIEFQFAKCDYRLTLGDTFFAKSTVLTDTPPGPPPTREEIAKFLSEFRQCEEPGYSISDHLFSQKGLPGLMFSGIHSPEERRRFHESIALLSEVGFYLKNSSSVTALDVNVQIRIEKVENCLLYDQSSKPKLISPTNFLSVTHQLNVNLEDCGSYWIIFLDVGKMQPHQEMWMKDVIYVGSKTPLTLPAEVKVFADNIPVPQEIKLSIKIETEEKYYRKEEWTWTEEE